MITYINIGILVTLIYSITGIPGIIMMIRRKRKKKLEYNKMMDEYYMENYGKHFEYNGSLGGLTVLQIIGFFAGMTILGIILWPGYITFSIVKLIIVIAKHIMNKD